MIILTINRLAYNKLKEDAYGNNPFKGLNLVDLNIYNILTVLAYNKLELDAYGNNSFKGLNLVNLNTYDILTVLS